MWNFVDINLMFLSLIGFANVIIGTVVLLQGNWRLPSTRYFAFGSLAAGLWVLVAPARYFIYAREGGAFEPYLFTKFSIFFALSIFFFFCLFAFSFLRKKLTLPRTVTLALFGLYAGVSTAGFFPGVMLTGEVFTEAAIQPIYNWAPAYYYLYIPTLIFFFAAGIIRLIQQFWINRGQKNIRRQLEPIIFGTGFAGLFGIFFGLLVASIEELVDLFWVGRLSTLFLTGFTAYAILKTRLFGVKVIATELLTFSIWAFLLVRALLSQTLSEQIINFALFFIVLVAGAFLIRSVVREVEAREEIERLASNLEKANVRLKELDRLKSEFLSIASHDLRAPLSSIRNFMSMLLEGTYGKLPPAAEEGARQVFDRASDMAGMVDDYLNVSRIEQGRMKYDFEQADLKKIVLRAVDTLRPNAEKKRLELLFYVPSGIQKIPIKADVSKLSEVFNNLIDNSIKYTPKGSVRVFIEGGDNTARVVIQDTGVGITEETKGRLFKLFSPGSFSRTINPSSTGVGLYVVKKHVEAHGGKVWAESSGEGKGSRFYVELPITQSPQEETLNKFADAL